MHINEQPMDGNGQQNPSNSFNSNFQNSNNGQYCTKEMGYNQPQAPRYQQPEDTAPRVGSPYEVVSVGQFLLMLIVLSIPLINIIMLIVWATSAHKINQKNYAIASLIMMAIAIVFSIIILVAFWGSIMALGGLSDW